MVRLCLNRRGMDVRGARAWEGEIRVAWTKVGSTGWRDMTSGFATWKLNERRCHVLRCRSLKE